MRQTQWTQLKKKSEASPPSRPAMLGIHTHPRWLVFSLTSGLLGANLATIQDVSARRTRQPSPVTSFKFPHECLPLDPSRSRGSRCPFHVRLSSDANIHSTVVRCANTADQVSQRQHLFYK